MRRTRCLWRTTTGTCSCGFTRYCATDWTRCTIKPSSLLMKRPRRGKTEKSPLQSLSDWNQRVSFDTTWFMNRALFGLHRLTLRMDSWWFVLCVNISVGKCWLDVNVDLLWLTSVLLFIQHCGRLQRKKYNIIFKSKLFIANHWPLNFNINEVHYFQMKSSPRITMRPS